MTTIHAYIHSQPILDAKDKKIQEKEDAGATNLTPSSTDRCCKSYFISNASIKR